MPHKNTADERLILSLASGLTVQAATKRSGLSERTVRRRMTDPNFRRRITESRGVMLEKALGRLASAHAAASEVLRQLLHSDSDATRLHAAKCIFEYGSKLHQTVEVNERLDAIERKLSDDSQPATSVGTYRNGHEPNKRFPKPA